MFPYFYPAVMPQYCPSVCPSVVFRYRDHICWNTSKIISPPNSDKIVMWRFLRNRRLLLCLHTIFRALIYWAHRAVVLAIAWHLVIPTSTCNFRKWRALYCWKEKKVVKTNNKNNCIISFMYASQKGRGLLTAYTFYPEAFDRGSKKGVDDRGDVRGHMPLPDHRHRST